MSVFLYLPFETIPIIFHFEKLNIVYRILPRGDEISCSSHLSPFSSSRLDPHQPLSWIHNLSTCSRLANMGEIRINLTRRHKTCPRRYSSVWGSFSNRWWKVRYTEGFIVPKVLYTENQGPSLLPIHLKSTPSTYILLPFS